MAHRTSLTPYKLHIKYTHMISLKCSTCFFILFIHICLFPSPFLFHFTLAVSCTSSMECILLSFFKCHSIQAPFHHRVIGYRSENESRLKITFLLRFPFIASVVGFYFVAVPEFPPDGAGVFSPAATRCFRAAHEPGI